MNHSLRSFSGMSLVELLLAMGIAGTLFGISSIVLSNLIPRASLESVTHLLQAELRHQQQKAMLGEKNSQGVPSEYGIFIEPQRYILFEGQVYDPDADGNIVIETPTAQLSVSPDQPIVFARGTGEIMNFVPNHHTITVQGRGRANTLRLNRYGIPE